MISLSGCYYGVNPETSQIGDLNDKCLEKNAWKKMVELYSIKNITDTNFLKKVDDVKNHFIKPDYILYFSEIPKEIIGCDYHSIRAVYNPQTADQVLSGLSPQLSDKEQIRIRNRVQKALMEYQCEEGKMISEEWMKKPAIFSKEYYDQ